MRRRTFIKNSSLVAGAIALPMPTIFANNDTLTLTILHTNDVHSRIDPFPMDGGKNQGLGGAAKRATIIKRIRKEVDNVLLLDAGDIFQGTPYFNFYQGEADIKLMTAMGYDAGTIGNHDFDGGIDNLHHQVKNHASFPLVNCNYNIDNTVLKEVVKPYQIIEKGGLKIGITGIGIKLKGLVPKDLYGETEYLDPVENLNKTAQYLVENEDCNYVICLSHIGYAYNRHPDKISDVTVAPQSKYVDLIIGGHTHTFLKEPTTFINKLGKKVLVTQAGWAGILLGRLDITFNHKGEKECVNCKNEKVK